MIRSSSRPDQDYGTARRVQPETGGTTTMNASAMRALASNGQQGITCSDCGALVPLTSLGDHVCGAPPPTPGLKARLEGAMQGLRNGVEATTSATARRAKKPAHIDIAPKGYASRHVPNGGLSPSPSSGSLSPSPSALSPSISNSTSASSGISGLSRSSSSTSGSSLHSPLNSPSLSAKLPFFDKYNRVYGSASGENSISLSRSPAQQDMATFDRPQISLTHARSGSSGSGGSLRRKPEAIIEDARHDRYRVAGFYDRKPNMGGELAKSRSDAGYGIKSREVAALAAKRDSGHNRARSDVGGGSGLDRSGSGREAMGRMLLGSSPKLPASSSFNGGMSRMAKSSTSNKLASVDALDDLLNDLSFDEGAMPTAARDVRPPSLDAYYFDDDGGISSDEEAAVTPRASAAHPSLGGAAIRSRRAHSPSPARNASTRPMSCSVCSTGVSPKQAIERDGARYCGSCYAERFLPKCRKCKLPIEGRAIGSGDGKVKGKFHADCFNCFSCSAPFPNKEFYVFDERPYCATHYHNLAGSMCTNCNSGIEGPCVSLNADEGGRKYHPSCFTCSHSNCTVLLPDFHYVLKGLPYCERHAERRATDRRAEKRRTVIQHVRRR